MKDNKVMDRKIPDTRQVHKTGFLKAYMGHLNATLEHLNHLTKKPPSTKPLNNALYEKGKHPSGGTHYSQNRLLRLSRQQILADMSAALRKAIERNL